MTRLGGKVKEHTRGTPLKVNYTQSQSRSRKSSVKIAPKLEGPNELKGKIGEIGFDSNTEHPRESDIQALKELLDGNKALKLWQNCMGMGELAENQVLNTITDDGDSGHGSRECWKQRLQAMRADLGHETSTPLERLLIQQLTLCWLNLNLLEYRHVNIMKQSITLTLGAYWDKRLSMAQHRFTRACESLARVRRLSRRIPVQVNIAAQGGQQINLAS